MSRRRVVGLTAGGLAALAVALATVPWCVRSSVSAPAVLLAQEARGPLRAGAAELAMRLPYPLVLAGYGPPRHEVPGATLPLSARAVVLQVGGVRFGLVSLDLLTLSDSVDEELRAATADLHLTDLWAVASHSHSSIGGYEKNLMHQLAGTGRYRPAVHRAVVEAGAEALRRAAAGLVDVTATTATASLAGKVASRNDVPAVDDALTVVRLRSQAGPVAELLVLAAHPTLRGRQIPRADPDYPGFLSEEERGVHRAGVTLVLQGAVGNADAVDIREGDDAPRDFARRIEDVVHRLPLKPLEDVRLGVARVRTALPAPDASRLVPPWARAAGSNFICANASRTAALGVVELGPLRWVSLPGEPTQEASLAVEQQAGAQRVLGVANGYLGYIEAAPRVAAHRGEARRQYFDATLAEVLGRAAHAAAEALDRAEREQVR